MIKKLILIILIAGISYYAGSQGITPNNLGSWLKKNDLAKAIKKTISKTYEMTSENMSTQKKL